MEDLIDNAHTLFDEYLPPSSPPLPPAPAGEPVPEVSYGSSHTTVALPRSGEAPGVDFTPQLPLGPTGSIHPSTRSNPPMSPSRLCADPSPSTTLAQSITPTPPPRIQIATNATEQPTREPVVSNKGTTEVVEKAPDPPQDIIPPLTAEREQYEGEQQLATESVPQTPLTASSIAGGSLSSSD
jgi:hypothetical protein